MTDTAEHPAPLAAEPPPRGLTVRYEDNPDGWVTAQIVEVPAAISQGRDEREAWVNVLEALRDVTHQPTASERIANMVQARIVDPLRGLLRRQVKRRKFEAWLRQQGAAFVRHGASHDVWAGAGVETAAIPRHREIKPRTARAICDQLGVPRPPGL